MTATVPAPLSRRAGARLLRSGLVDLLLGPHGVDRYLELISPAGTVRDARAEVTSVRRQTARSVTLTLAPNRAWEGFAAGQFIRAGFELDGVRRTRIYSPASSAHGRALELTIAEHPGGVVSSRLQHGLTPGSIVHLAPAQGSFVLPAVGPQHLVLISGGSGITPVMSMLRTLVDEEHRGAITFLHYARAGADWLYQPEVRALAARAAGPVQVQYLTANLTRNVWSFMIIFCGHFPEGTEEFTEDEVQGETRGGWYVRQMLGSANLTGGRLFHLLSGNLSHQIERHLFPDIPAHRYAEIATEVRDICERYGLPYNTGPLGRQFGSVLKKIARLALPGRGRQAAEPGAPPLPVPTPRAGRTPDRERTPVLTAA